MTHYETLGVERSASAEEIKAAYRRRSSAAHPDKGGSDDEMQAVNRAYETLSDPERRKAYDESGSDSLRAPIEQEARDALLQLFKAAIDHEADNPVRDAGAMLAEHARRISDNHVKAMALRVRLAGRRDKVRVKSGENLVQMLIDQQVRQLAQQISSMERALEINRIARDMMTAYEADEAPAPQQSGGWTLLGSLGGR